MDEIQPVVDRVRLRRIHAEHFGQVVRTGPLIGGQIQDKTSQQGSPLRFPHGIVCLALPGHIVGNAEYPEQIAGRIVHRLFCGLQGMQKTVCRRHAFRDRQRAVFGQHTQIDLANLGHRLRREQVRIRFSFHRVRRQAEKFLGHFVCHKIAALRILDPYHVGYRGQDVFQERTLEFQFLGVPMYGSAQDGDPGGKQNSQQSDTDQYKNRIAHVRTFSFCV